MRFLSRLVWIPILLICLAFIVLFVISNPQPINISFWPLKAEVTQPLWASILGAFGVGLLLGSGFVWLASLGTRAKLSVTQRKLQKTNDELASLKQQQETKSLESV